MSLPSEVDVAIIGAGAAGLGAARALENSGLSSSCWKRATASADAATPSWRRPTSPSTSAAAGCIRPTENSFVRIAEQLNFEIDKTRPPWREQACARGLSAAAARRIHRALDAFYDRAEEAAKRPATPAATSPRISISNPATAGIR